MYIYIHVYIYNIRIQSLEIYIYTSMIRSSETYQSTSYELNLLRDSVCRVTLIPQVMMMMST
jgi:hypothetical protein